MDEVTEIEKEVRRLHKLIFELNKRRLNLIKKAKRQQDNGPVSPETLAIPVASLRLTARTWNAFKDYNINTLGDLVQMHEIDFRRMECFGEKSLLEVKNVLLTFGLMLKGDE